MKTQLEDKSSMDESASSLSRGSSESTKPIPGPAQLPVLGWRGNLLPLLRDPIPYMMKLHRTYGDIASLARNDQDYVFVFSPEYNRQVLSDQNLFHNGEVNSPGSVVHIPEGSPALKLLSGITTMNGAKHTQQRRLLMPAFHKRRVEAMRDGMVEIIESRASRLKPGVEIDLLREMKSLTLAVAIKAILGLDPDAEGDAMRRSMESWFKVALSFPVVALPFDVPGLPFHKMLRMSVGLEREIHEMINRRRKSLAAGNDEGLDALSLLVQAHDEDGTYLTDEDLVGQTTALFIAGHETTASALTWTLFLLAQHPQVYMDLLDELNGTLHGGAPTTEQLTQLPLLDAVINESMRLFPPGLWFLRVATRPYRFGEYEVAANTRILWSPAVVHRREDLYPEPTKFMPERWSSINPTTYEFMPFGAGPRRCLGATFAITEMKLALPILLQRYRFAMPAGTKVDMAPSPLATPRGGLTMLVGRPRGKPSAAPVTGNIRQLVDLPL